MISNKLIIGLVGWILFAVNLFRYLSLGKKVNTDSKLKEALNNEMHELYMYKSVFWGFWTVLATICIFIVISLFYQVSSIIVCELTLFFGILSSLIAGLIYNRD